MVDSSSSGGEMTSAIVDEQGRQQQQQRQCFPPRDDNDDRVNGVGGESITEDYSCVPGTGGGVEQTRGGRGLRVLFLSSDTGGGHRASAESLAKQFQLQYPGTTYDLVDVMSLEGVFPYNTLVPAYKHLSAHPSQWKIVYEVSNWRSYDILAGVYLQLMCERAIRKRIQAYNPDVVVSVHPLMTKIPVVACHRISSETDRHLPMFTVVTDLGSGHCLWFAKDVEKVFIASNQIRHLAQSRGGVPDDKLVQVGLPIRHDFAVQAEALGTDGRYSDVGRRYQKIIRRELDLDLKVPTVWVMGGGEGVGSLSDIVDALYICLARRGVDANIVVICGRNDTLRKDLAHRDWNRVLSRSYSLWNGVMGVGQDLVTIFAELALTDGEKNMMQILGELEENKPRLGAVSVKPLGFVTHMAKYMVASDLLITKAGPGTIAEAAAVGLPLILTSFLPGQEEGNVDFVVEGGFGVYKPDSDPDGIAAEVASCLEDVERLEDMSLAAMGCGAPHAASDIVGKIGESTLRWKELNEHFATAAATTGDKTKSDGGSVEKSSSPRSVLKLQHQQHETYHDDQVGILKGKMSQHRDEGYATMVN